MNPADLFLVVSLAILIAIPLAFVMNRIAHYFKFRKFIQQMGAARERDVDGRFRSKKKAT